MPKGDAQRTQNQLDYQKNRSEDQMNQRWIETGNLAGDTSANYNRAAQQGFADQANLMGQYQNIANTGGYTPEGIAAMRSRANAPITALYANANRDVDRSRALTGGGANYAATKAKMAREMSMGLGENANNTEANLAQMQQQGQLQGLSGMAGVYGMAPGAANMYGQQNLQAQGLRNDLMNQQNQFGLGLVGAQMNKGQMPGNYDIGLNRYSGTVSAIGKTAMIAGMSSRDSKDIHFELTEENILNQLAELPIFLWNYKGDDITHMGPTAEDFKEKFGVGDGKTIALIDVMGITMLALKALALKEGVGHGV